MEFCIYCLKQKPESEFNTEHVIQQSFGRFDGANLVLTCVCTECNGYFGRELDEKLACDSVEGIERVRVGLKPAAKFRTLGRRSTTRVEIPRGVMKGVRGHHVPSADGKRLDVTPLPQIGFARTEDEEIGRYYTLDELPTRDEVVEALGIKKGETICVRTWGLPISDAIDALVAKGFPRFTETTEIPVPTGPQYMETVGLIAGPELRAFTKIALNYVAFATSPAVARMPAFNEARAFVRHGTKPPTRIVSVTGNPWEVMQGPDDRAVRGHYISLSAVGDNIVVQISLLLCMRYVVVLARGGFAITFPNIFSSAHFFDIDAKTIAAGPPLPLDRPNRPDERVAFVARS